jgi:phage terminase large subunit
MYGADWGFANDPTTLVRMWTTGSAPEEELWISHEAWKVGCEIDETPKLFDTVPGSRIWPIKADNARPETISYVRRQGFNIAPAEKWDGCIEDRIAHIKGYKLIHVHERCKNTQFELRNYRYKRDRVTNEVLPVVIDKNNHIVDAIGYGHDGRIQRRGVAGIWAKL